MALFWVKQFCTNVNCLNRNYQLASDFGLRTIFSMDEEVVSLGISLTCFRASSDSRSALMKVEYDLEVMKVCISLKCTSALKL